MKRSPICRPALVLLGALLLALAIRPAVTASEPHPGVKDAWEAVQEAGSYRFLSSIDQTLVPRPIPGMIGEQEQRLNLTTRGAVQLPDRAYLEIWAERGATEVPPVVLIHDGNQTFMQQDGKIAPVEDPAAAVAPTGDWLGYLVAAKNVQLIEPASAEAVALVGFRFEIDGPRLAEYVSQQMEDGLRQEPDAPPDLSVAPSPLLSSLTGRGELWVGADGLPRRQVLDLSLPGASSAYDARMHVVVDLSDFGQVESLPRAVRDEDGGWLVQHIEPGPPTAASGLPRPAPVGAPIRAALADLVVLGPCLILAAVAALYLRRPRQTYAAIVIAVVVIMVVTPVLKSVQALGFFEGQAEAAEARARAAPELARALGLEIEPGPATAGQAMVDDRRPGDLPALASAPVTLSAEAPRPDPVALPLAYSPAQAGQDREVALIEACGDGDPTADLDQDGLNDQAEGCLGTNPYAVDSDGDGLDDKLELDGFEYAGRTWTTNPLEVDSNHDGLFDLLEWPEPEGLARSADTDGDGTPDLWDEDNDGDNVPDEVDLSPMAFTSDYAEAFNLTVNPDPGFDGYQYVELQVQPASANHLRYSTTALDWPYDERGNVQDRNNGSDDIRLSPALLITTNVDPGGELEAQYGFHVWPLEDGGYTLLVPLSPVGAGGAVDAFQGKVAYGPAAAASPAVEWQNARMVWLVQDTVGGPRPGSSFLHRYTEDAFRLTGLRVSKSQNYEFAVFATPDTPLEDMDLLKLQLGLNATFLSYHTLDLQKELGQTALEHVAYRFEHQDSYSELSPAYTWGVTRTVQVRYSLAQHQDAGMAALFESANELLNDAGYTSNICKDLKEHQFICGSLVMAYQEDLGVTDLGELDELDPKSLNFSLAAVPLTTWRGARLGTFEYHGSEGWQFVTPAQMLAFAEARYAARYADLAKRYPGLDASDMRFATYATYLAAAAGSQSLSQEGGRPVLPEESGDEVLLMEDVLQLGTGYWSPLTLPDLIVALKYTKTYKPGTGTLWRSTRLAGPVGSTYKGLLLWAPSVVAGAGMVTSVFNLVCLEDPEAGYCDSAAFDVANKVVALSGVVASVLAMVEAAIPTTFAAGAETASMWTVGLAVVFVAIGIGLSWAAFGIIASKADPGSMAYELAWRSALVTTVWLMFLMIVFLSGPVGAVVGALLGLLDAVLMMWGYSVSRFLAEGRQLTEPGSHTVSDWHLDYEDAALGPIAGNTYVITASHEGYVKESDPDWTELEDLNESWVKGEIKPHDVDSRVTASEENAPSPDCHTVDNRRECQNEMRARWGPLPAGRDLELNFDQVTTYNYVYAIYAFYNAFRWDTKSATMQVPKEDEREPIDLYLDVLPATVEELWYWDELTNLDPDGDDLRNESDTATDPGNWDTDGDGLSDGFEQRTEGLDPTNPDSDGDGLADGQELRRGTAPGAPDSDGDGLSDGAEVNGWEVGLPGGATVRVFSDPLADDADGDGLKDAAEKQNGFSPYAVNPGPVLQLQVIPYGVGPGGKWGVYVPAGQQLTLRLWLFNGSAEPIADTLSLCLPAAIDSSTIDAWTGDAQPALVTNPCSCANGGYAWSFAGAQSLQPMATVSATLTAQVGQPSQTTSDRIVAKLPMSKKILTDTATIWIDRNAPRVTFDVPLDGAILSGQSMVVRGTASDPTSWVDRVELTLPGQASSAAGTGEWAYTWTLPDDGEHTLVARAYDHAGNSRETTVRVTVDNTSPKVTTTTDDLVRSQAGTIHLAGVASDATSGLSRVQLSINQRPWHSVPLMLSGPNNGTWTYEWTVGAAAQGSHSIRVRAIDRAGNLSDPQEKTIVVDQVPPSDALADRTYLHAPPAAAVGQPYVLTGVADEGGYLPRPSHPGALVGDKDVFEDSNVWLGLSTISDADQGVQATWLGDFNNDRMADLAVGLPAAAKGAGQVFVVYGRAGNWAVPPAMELLAASETVLIGAEGAGLGAIVTAAGDVDGDSFADLLVGQSSSRRAFLVRGRAHSLGQQQLDQPQRGSIVALDAPDPITGLTAAGDTNADGLDDVLVTTNAGQSYLLVGGTKFLSDILDVAAIATLWAGGPPASDNPGDVDGDGVNDQLTISDDQAVLTLSGGRSVIINGVASAAPAPFASGADVNGDGSSDLLLSPSGQAAESWGFAYGEPSVVSTSALPRAATGASPPTGEPVLAMTTSVEAVVSAGTFFVDDDDPTCGGNAPCYDSIQTAVGAADDAGDTIVVGPGVYPPFEVGPGKDHLTIRGVDPDAVFVDGGGTATYAVHISNTVGVTLTHITLRSAERGVWLEQAGDRGYENPSNRTTLDHLLVHACDHALYLDRQSTALVRHCTLAGKGQDQALVEVQEETSPGPLPQWEVAAKVPQDIQEGGVLVRAGRTLYALPGGDGSGVYSYDQEGGQWLPESPVPQNINTRSAVAGDPDGNLWLLPETFGRPNGPVEVLAMDGAGNLYAGGNFTEIEGQPVNYIAMWDGQQWSDLGGGLNGRVRALVVDHAGNLYAGGDFTQTVEPRVFANYIARWNKSTQNWERLGDGVDATVRAIALTGDNVYAGGDFTEAGGHSAKYIAMWNGRAWSGLGSGLNGPASILAADQAGNMYVSGAFDRAGEIAVDHIAKWASGWAAMGWPSETMRSHRPSYSDWEGVNVPPQSMAVFNDGRVRTTYYVRFGYGESLGGGDWCKVTDDGVFQLEWSGTGWRVLSFEQHWYNPLLVNDLLAIDDEQNSYAVKKKVYWGPSQSCHFRGDGGYFHSYDDGPIVASGSSSSRYIYKNGQEIGAASGWIAALAAGSDAVYVGGDFTQVSGRAVKNIALWDGLHWSPPQAPFYLYDGLRWLARSSPPTPVDKARMVSTASDTLYLLPDHGRLFEYSIADDSWAERASLPATKGDFALAWADGSLYALRGNQLYRYDVPPKNTWAPLAPLPVEITIGSGVGMTPDRDANPRYLYVMVGGGDDKLVRYDMTSNAWDTNLPGASASFQVEVGNGLVSKDSYLYLYASPIVPDNFFRYGELVDPVTRLTFESTAFVASDGASSAWNNLDPSAAPDFHIDLAGDNAWVSQDATWGPDPALGWGRRLSFSDADLIGREYGAYRVGSETQLQAGYYVYHPDATVFPSRQSCQQCDQRSLVWGETAFDNIQAAIDSGATRVRVRPGVYPGLVYLVSGVELLGAGAELSLIEAPSGFSGPLVRGEGIAAATLSNLTLAGNHATTGFHLEGGAQGVRLARNIVRDQATGVLVEGASLEVLNNTIVDNVDGMRVTGSASLNVRNTIFAFNRSTGLDWTEAASVSNTYNDFWANGDDPHPDAVGGGKIFLDPLLVSPLTHDYRLGAWSPAIDAGDPSDGAPPGTGGVVDIGYREYGRASYYADVGYGPNQLNDGLTWGVDAFDTIGDALAAAAEDIAMVASGGSTDDLRLSVGVGPGIYHEAVSVPSYVHLIGSGADETTLDAGGTGSAVTFNGVVQAEVSGFTLKRAGIDAAGVVVAGASNNIRITRNLIVDNTGDGVRFSERSSGTVSFSTIADNNGTGLRAEDLHTTLAVENNIISSNSSGGISAVAQALVRNRYNLLWNNTFAGVEPGEGTVSQDPALSGTHRYLIKNSPAVDAGSPFADVPPGGGERADMGYKELLASPLVLLFGPEIQSTVTANSGVAEVEVGVTPVDLDPELAPRSSLTETLPTNWYDATLRNPNAPYSLWTYTVTPSETKLYRVYSRASDALGNSETDETVWYAGAVVGDDAPPDVTWVRPTGRVTTEAAALELVARASDYIDDGQGLRFQVAQVYFSVNGQTYPAEWVDELGWHPRSGLPRTFRAWVPLETGLYTVAAVAVDGAGHAGQSVERHITVRQADPPGVATITSHTDRQAVDETELELAGYVRFGPASAEREVRVQVGSDLIVPAILADPAALVSTWWATVTLPAVDDHHLITVSVNSQVSDRLTVLLDRQPPSLTVRTPRPGDYVTRTVTFEATAEDLESSLAAVQVSLDGGYTWRPAEPAGRSWRLAWDLTEWQDCVSHPAVVRAVDMAGNETRQTLPVTVDNLPPTGMEPVTFSSEPGTYVDAGTTLDVSWEPATDASGQATVLLEVDRVPETEPSQAIAGTNYSTPLSAGQWYVHLAAQDPAGNRILRHYGPWYVQEMRLDGYIDTGHGEWLPATELLDDDERPARTQNLFATWDGQAIYLGWQGAWWPLDGTMWAYLGHRGGSTPRVDGLGEVPLAATYAVEVVDSETGRLWARKGDSWSEQPLEFAYSGHGDTEVRLPWSGSAYLLAFALDRNGTPQSIFPTTNPLDGPWTQVYGWPSLSVPPAPNAGQPQAESVALSISSPQEGRAHWGPGDNPNYRIRVHNYEASALSNLQLSLTASPGLGYRGPITGAACGSCPPDGQVWDLTIPYLAAKTTQIVTVTGQLAVDLTGLEVVTATAVMPVSNLGPVQYGHRVDGQPPSVQVSVPPGNAVRPGQPTISGVADDGTGSGVALVEVRPAGQTWQRANGTLAWTTEAKVSSSDSTFTLAVRATDEMGNTGEEVSHTFDVDGTAPVLTFTVPMTLTGDYAGLRGSSYDPAPPASSLVDRVEVQLDGEGRLWQLVSGPFAPGEHGTQAWMFVWDLPLEDGVTHSLRARAIDVAGNEAVSGWQPTVVDTVAPTVTVETVLEQGLLSDYDAGNPNRDPEPLVSGGVSDGGGLSTVLARIDTPNGLQVIALADLQGAAFRITPTFDDPVSGEYRYYIEATDIVGNLTTVGPFTFTDLNAPPEAADDGYTTDNRSALDVLAPGLLANDLDPDRSDTLVIVAVDDGELLGSLVWQPDGSFAYDPAGQFESLAAGEEGIDAFGYTVSDGHGGVAQATVTITVTAGPANRPPVAHEQLVTTLRDTPMNVTLAASDPDGDPLAFRVVTSPAHGVLTGSAPALRYLPETGYTGEDSFAFQASDGRLDSGTAQVSIIVGVPPVPLQECTGPNMVQNGDFEQGFSRSGVGIGWGSFHSSAGAAYGFYDDWWGPVVYGGAHSQLLAISTRGILAGADRYVGIYQTVTGLAPGAIYELSIAGMMREEALHPDEDPYRYQVQWAYTPHGGDDWTRVAGWHDLPWHALYPRTDPGAFEVYTTQFVAPSQPVTIVIRVWKKWPTSGRELNVNLDGIALRRCQPVGE